MNKIKTSFFTGIGALLPIGLTLYIIIKGFTIVDEIVQGWIKSVFGYELVGIGFVAFIIITILVGAFTNTYLAKKITLIIDSIFKRIPIIKSIYFTLQEVVSISNPSKTNFQKVVLVEFPNKGIQSMGFITKQNVSINNNSKIAVFIPTTPNPTNGFLIYVEQDKLEVLDMKVEEAIKSIISIGALTPNDINFK